MVVNDTFIFDYPWFLLGLAVVVPLILFDHFSVHRRHILKILPGNLLVRLSVSRILFRISLVCLIIALAGPRWGIGPARSEYRRDLDTVIAIDVSRSMDLPDGKASGTAEGPARGPTDGTASGTADGTAVSFADGRTDGISRRERGVAIVREAVEALPGMRFAIAVSRNRGIVAIPLTWDTGTVLSFLEALDDSALTGRGTNLESLLDAAAGAFQSSHHSSKVILLVSDGESLSGSLNAALGRCRRDGITVTPIAVGSDEGMAIAGYGGIISRRETHALRSAARETGGIFIDGSRDDAAAVLIAHLRSLAVESRTTEGRPERKARWFIFAFTAILCFGVSKLCLLQIKRDE